MNFVTRPVDVTGDVGRSVGVTRQTINAIERAKYSPSLEVASRFADTIGVPIDEVFQHRT